MITPLLKFTVNSKQDTETVNTQEFYPVLAMERGEFGSCVLICNDKMELQWLHFSDVIVRTIEFTEWQKLDHITKR